jgi:NADPH-dependent curcumin reductase CurA
MTDSVWLKNGGTLSDKSARKEFGLSQEEIIDAIKSGKLQFRKNYMHGNPYLRLVRDEVEALVVEKYGDNYFEKKKLKKKLSQVNQELRRMKGKIVLLEKRKNEILDELGE